MMPTNYDRPWNDNLDDILRRGFKANKSIQTLAGLVGKTEVQVRSRLLILRLQRNPYTYGLTFKKKG